MDFFVFAYVLDVQNFKSQFGNARYRIDDTYRTTVRTVQDAGPFLVTTKMRKPTRPKFVPFDGFGLPPSCYYSSINLSTW